MFRPTSQIQRMCGLPGLGMRLPSTWDRPRNPVLTPGLKESFAKCSSHDLDFFCMIREVLFYSSKNPKRRIKNLDLYHRLLAMRSEVGASQVFM